MSYHFLEKGVIAIHDDPLVHLSLGREWRRAGRPQFKDTDPRRGGIERLSSKCDDIQVFPGDLLHYDTWGGGGWGDPLQRDAQLVAQDVRRGLVTQEGALRYGVVVDTDSKVATAETEALRAKIAAERKNSGIFNYGPTLDELRAAVWKNRSPGTEEASGGDPRLSSGCRISFILKSHTRSPDLIRGSRANYPRRSVGDRRVQAPAMTI